MTYSVPLLIIGFLGFVVFTAAGIGAFTPWVASGPFALAFLGLIITEIREYFQAVKPKPAPSGDATRIPRNSSQAQPRQTILFWKMPLCFSPRKLLHTQFDRMDSEIQFSEPVEG